MPNRYLRDGILASRAVNELSWPGEVLYRRLLSAVDDFGRYDADPAVLRAVLYPKKIDQVREADVQRWIAECVKAGLIVLYDEGNKSTLVVLKVERPRAKWSKHLQPPEGVMCWRTVSAEGHVNICAQMQADDNSCQHMRSTPTPTPTPIPNTPHSPPRGGGGDSKIGKRKRLPRDPGDRLAAMLEDE